MNISFLFLLGVCISLSSVKAEIEALKQQHESEELRITGLSAIHIDCDLLKDVWHGTNVTVRLFLSVIFLRQFYTLVKKLYEK